jgi:hypothetical protein
VLLAALVALAASAGSAAAFWPFTRGVVPASTDTLTEAHIAARFAAWKSAAVADTAGAAATAAGAARAKLSPEAEARMRQLFGDEVVAAAPDTMPVAVDSTAAAPRPDSVPAAAGAAAAADTTNEAGVAAGDAAGAAAGGAGGATASPTPAQRAAAEAAAEAMGFAPRLTAKLATSNDSQRLTSDLATTFRDASGVTLASALSFIDDVSLTQKSDTETRSITNSFSAPLRARGFTFNLSTGNQRMSRVGGRTASGASTRDATENKSAAASLVVSRELAQTPVLHRLGDVVRGTSLNGFVTRNFSQNEQNIVATVGTGSGDRRHAGSGYAFGGGVGFDRWKWVSLKARAGRASTRNLDRSPSLATGEQESTSDGDTASVDVTVPARGRFLQGATFSIRASQGSDTFLDAARTGTGAQSGQIGNFVVETRRSFSRGLNLSLKLKPLKPLDLTVEVEAARDSTSYKIRANGFLDTRRFAWRLDSRLAFWTDGILAAKFDVYRNDFGQDEARNPRNPLTRTEEHRKLYLEMSKNFSKTLKIRTYYEIQLDQAFYEHEGPQGLGDRDELRTRVGTDFSGSAGPNVTVSVTAYVRTYDQVFLDARRSVNSSNETEYVVRPSYTWKVRPKLSMSQSFGLSSKVVDEIFNPERNTLNRNHFMDLRMDYELTSRVRMGAEYHYLLQDNGNYTSAAGSSQRFFTPTARTKKDGIGVGMKYDVLPDGKLSFVSRQESTRLRSTRFSGRGPTVSEQGNLALGFESKLKMGELDLDCNVRRNQSFNVQLNRNVYYNIDATVSYTF